MDVTAAELALSDAERLNDCEKSLGVFHYVWPISARALVVRKGELAGAVWN